MSAAEREEADGLAVAPQHQHLAPAEHPLADESAVLVGRVQRPAATASPRGGKR